MQRGSEDYNGNHRTRDDIHCKTREEEEEEEEEDDEEEEGEEEGEGEGGGGGDEELQGERGESEGREGACPSESDFSDPSGSCASASSSFPPFPASALALSRYLSRVTSASDLKALLLEKTDTYSQALVMGRLVELLLAQQHQDDCHRNSDWLQYIRKEESDKEGMQAEDIGQTKEMRNVSDQARRPPVQQTIQQLEVLVHPTDNRTGHATVWVPNQLLVIGGDNTTQVCNTVERYDQHTNSWKQMGGSGLLWSQGNTSGKNGFGTAVLDGDVYAIGGSDAVHWLTSVEKFESRLNKWVYVSDLIIARFGGAAATLGGKIYMIGGHNNRIALTSVERYDPKLNTWEFVASINVQRSYATAVVLEGHLYVLGGSDVSQNTCTSWATVEWYDAVSNKWVMLQAPMLHRRSGGSSAVVDGVLYVMGGEACDGFLSSVERFDPKGARQWELVAPMSVARQFFASAVLSGQIYAIGGGAKEEGLYHVERYDPLTDQWTDVAPLLRMRAGHGAAAAADFSRIMSVSEFSD
eukprot:gb/GEZN01003803.1/.p1 GENE.gb/GEZN01003803.1/~~gb/GEZN01003803.1/.p1  ORF type:complete len:524 (-),score=96.69 gb/GEZN01003803.1/:144-1715(-)